MYYIIVICTMFVFPLLSILYGILLRNDPNILLLIGKWFVFWAIGIRAFTAGIRQIIQPKFTAEKILGLKEIESLILVRELGFANTSLGILGILSLFVNEWIIPSALAGAVFFGLAGINHVFVKNKNNHEKVAMLSNLFVFAVLVSFLLITVIK